MTSLFLFVVGACLGSFAVAQVWRLRARQLEGLKQAHKKYDKAEYSRLHKLVGHTVQRDRSVCLACGYQLRWLDLLPVVSWALLRGKCRKCRKPIGLAEFAAEMLLGALFVVSYLFWPYQLATVPSIIALAVWFVLLTALAVLFIYDLKWSQMPSKLLYFCVVCAIIFLICNILQGSFGVAQIPSLVVALVVLPGLYLALNLVSKGKWVGDGDYILAISLALVLANYFSAVMTLFLSNLLGCLVYVFIALANRQNRPKRIPFGPLLIVGFLLAFFINWARLGLTL
ncbi:MAG: prepilin peptidase [Candidatus Nomurabacteria bacterium]|jgi:leader peptidase (prepilin peptidase)/N-methyltransferase|nr:prepilin peptidase [Candidatus Nomurabacteria bacterium]